MVEQKYIIFDNIFPIIFSIGLNHNDVICKGRTATSAGFCQIIYNEENDQFESKCYGESISLGIKSKPKEDDKILI